MERARVAARLSKALSFPIVILQAPAGSGKSVALRDALLADLRPQVLFDVAPEHATLPRFAHGLAEALARHAPGARIAFASAYDRAVLSDQPAHALALWLHEHIKNLNLTIAIDNAHNADGATVQAFLGRLIDLGGPSLRWALTCRTCDYLPVANWLASSWTGLPIEEDDLAFTPDEILALSRERGAPIDESTAQAIFERTGGWAAGVAFGRIASSYEPIVDEVLWKSEPATLSALFPTYYLPDLSVELLSAVGGARLIELIDELRDQAPFLFVRTNGALRFHDVFREALRLRVADAEESVASGALERASNELTKRGRYVDVLRLRFAGNVEACLEILDEHGLQLIEQGHADVVDAAVARLQRAGAELPPRVTALRALIDSRLGRLDTAESWFNQALASVEDDDERMIEIKYLYACDLLRRDRLDCLPLLREHVENPSITPALRASILSALAEALQLSGEPDAARAAIASAIDIDREAGEAELHARILTRAAYVYLYQDDYTRARAYAIAAARAAADASLYTVATGAYSVLYVIAFDEEQVEAALHYLDLMMESCLKSGNLQFQFYCLACMFEIEVERNNLPAIRRIDSMMTSFDLHIGGSASDEAFLPGNALRSAGRGDFERAYRLLYPTATHQAGAERIAQRWAEVALYATGAKRHTEAAEALDRGLAALADCGTASARSARARLYFALALSLMGRAVESAELLREVATAATLPERLRTIEAGVAAICRYASGADNYRDVAGALRLMHDRDCGGIARVFEALPSPTFFARESLL